MGRVSLISVLKRYIKGLQPINLSVKNEIINNGSILKNKTAIITGGSRGIGFAIAKTFIAQGATVIAIAKHNESLLDAKRNIQSNRFIPLPFDLTKFDEYDYLHEEITRKSNGSIDILVNAAGLKNGQEAKFWDFTSSEFDDCMAVNAKVPFFLSRLVAKDMIANNVRGNIINIGGIKSFIGEPSPYSMSKFAQNSLTKGLARMLAPYGICMNGIAPGATNTSNFVNLYLTDTSNCRYSTPDEIANIALLLASDLCRSMVGSIVICDGGEMLQYKNDRY